MQLRISILILLLFGSIQAPHPEIWTARIEISATVGRLGVGRVLVRLRVEAPRLFFYHLLDALVGVAIWGTKLIDVCSFVRKMRAPTFSGCTDRNRLLGQAPCF